LPDKTNVARMSTRITRRNFIKGAALTSGLALAAGRRATADLQPPPDRPPKYPDDSFSRPVADRWPTFATLAGLSPGGSVHTRAALFRTRPGEGPPPHRLGIDNTLELAEVDGATVTRWRLTPVNTEVASLHIDERIRRRPTALSFRARNLSDRPMQVAVDLPETPWTPGRESRSLPWRLGPPQTLASREDRELRFDIGDAYWPGRTEPAEPQWPTGAVDVSFAGLERGASYELLLSDLTVHYPAAPGISATVAAPSILPAGAEAVFDVMLDGAPALGVVDLEVRREPWVLWRIRLTQEEVGSLGRGECRVVRDVPWYASPAEVTVGLVVDGYRVQGVEATARIMNDKRGELPHAERRIAGGRPCMTIDGTPVAWQGYSSYEYQPGSVAEFGAHGVNVFCIPTDAGGHVHHVAASPNWQGDDRYDFGQIDERVGFSLQANPDGLLFFRISLALPRFWAVAHEDDLALVHTEAGFLVWEEASAYCAPSLASDVWRGHQEKALRRVLRYCSSQPWADRIAGFWLTCEVTEEWFAWACNDGAYTDYSAPNQQRFAQWAEAHCPETRQDNGLQPIAVPLPDARKCPGHDVYPDDDAHRLAAAYHRYYSEFTAETISHFARIVKDETRGRSLVGAFFGYVIQLAGEPRQATSGHFDSRRLIEDPNVDFLGGIPLHDFRVLANGYNGYVTAYESIAAAGKLYCNENDLFSWLHALIWYTEYDSADPRGGAISMHRRECAGDAVRGAMAQKFSLMCSWHHDQALQQEFARQARLYASALDMDRTPVEEIAFVVDEMTFAWTPPESTLLTATNKLFLHAVGRTGAPVGVWLLSDLDKLPGRSRFVVIASATAPALEDLAKLRALLAGGGRTVLVVGAPGLVDTRTWRRSPDAPAEVLSLPIVVRDGSLRAEMLLAADGSSVTSLAQPVRPRVEIAGEGLLRYSDGPCAHAERELPNGGRLIWCGLPPLNQLMLRDWVDAAGVHCYAPAGFFVHASRELVSVTSWADCTIPLSWPHRVSVEDLFTGWAATGSQFDCPFEAGQTRVFRVG